MPRHDICRCGKPLYAGNTIGLCASCWGIEQGLAQGRKKRARRYRKSILASPTKRWKKRAVLLLEGWIATRTKGIIKERRR